MPMSATLQKKQDANGWEQQEIHLNKKRFRILGGDTIASLPSLCLVDAAVPLSIWPPNRTGAAAGVLQPCRPATEAPLALLQSLLSLHCLQQPQVSHIPCFT